MRSAGSRKDRVQGFTSACEVSKNGWSTNYRCLKSLQVTAPTINSSLSKTSTTINCLFILNLFFELPLHHSSPGGTKFSLTLFNLSFHSHFVFSLRNVHSNLHCPKKQTKAERGDILKSYSSNTKLIDSPVLMLWQKCTEDRLKNKLSQKIVILVELH